MRKNNFVKIWVKVQQPTKPSLLKQPILNTLSISLERAWAVEQNLKKKI